MASGLALTARGPDGSQRAFVLLGISWHTLAYTGTPWQTLFRISPALTAQLRFEVPGATRTHRLSLGELLKNGLQARTRAFEMLAPLMPPCLGHDFTIRNRCAKHRSSCRCSNPWAKVETLPAKVPVLARL